MSFLKDLLAVPANLRRIAAATESLAKKYAPPAPPDLRYTPRTYQSEK